MCLLRESTRVYLDSSSLLWPLELTKVVKCRSNRAHLVFCPSRITIIQCLIASALKTTLLVLLSRFFGCFRWERKSGPSYSNLARIRSHMVSLAAKSHHYIISSDKHWNLITFFLCVGEARCRWESKSGPSYTNLATVGSHMISLAAKSRRYIISSGKHWNVILAGRGRPVLVLIVETRMDYHNRYVMTLILESAKGSMDYKLEAWFSRSGSKKIEY